MAPCIHSVLREADALGKDPWEFTGAMSGRLRREELTVAEQHQPGCRADRQEASDGSVVWRVLGREPRHHSSTRRLGSLHLAGTARQHPSSVPSWEARRDRVGSQGASPQALIDNIPIALCTGALNEFPPGSRHLRVILIFRQEWKGCDLSGIIHPRLRSRA